MHPYFLSAVIFLVLDSIYLNMIKNYFNIQIKVIQGFNIQINIIATIITYIFLIFGLNYFIIREKRSVKDAALLGFVIYGVYEFTNLALFKKWFLLTALVDTVWGALLFGITTAIVYKMKN
jgi:uncharacterized membrane protein